MACMQVWRCRGSECAVNESSVNYAPVQGGPASDLYADVVRRALYALTRSSSSSSWLRTCASLPVLCENHRFVLVHQCHSLPPKAFSHPCLHHMIARASAHQRIVLSAVGHSRPRGLIRTSVINAHAWERVHAEEGERMAGDSETEFVSLELVPAPRARTRDRAAAPNTPLDPVLCG